jgi:hypothetical protein
LESVDRGKIRTLVEGHEISHELFCIDATLGRRTGLAWVGYSSKRRRGGEEEEVKQH